MLQKHRLVYFYGYCDQCEGFIYNGRNLGSGRETGLELILLSIYEVRNRQLFVQEPVEEPFLRSLARIAPHIADEDSDLLREAIAAKLKWFWEDATAEEKSRFAGTVYQREKGGSFTLDTNRMSEGELRLNRLWILSERGQSAVLGIRDFLTLIK